MHTFKDVTYRVGTPTDLPGLIFFVENIKQENPLVDQFKYDLKKCHEVLKRIIEQDQGVILIAEKDGIIIGSIVLGKIKIWWTNKEILTDLFFFVNPSVRHLGVQAKLLDLVKTFADDLKMPIMLDIFNAADEERNEKLARYLSIKQFKNVGFKALYVPKE